jgi:hypothetical protein
MSLVIEIVGAGCLLGSVSDYYYTPVHAVFIGSLLALGVALIALKGRDTIEDLALNLAGVMAPMVAFVPTARSNSACLADSDELLVSHSALVANNVVALLAGAALAVAVAYVVAWRQHKVHDIRVSPSAVVGTALSLATLAVGVIWYATGRTSFEERAHGFTAVLMFIAFWLAVLVNAGWPAGPLRFLYRVLRAPAPDPLGASANYQGWYRVISVAMAGFAIIALASLSIEWDHRIFWLELAEILAFGTFWTLQTLEAWEAGPAADVPVSSAP